MSNWKAENPEYFCNQSSTNTLCDSGNQRIESPTEDEANDEKTFFMSLKDFISSTYYKRISIVVVIVDIIAMNSFYNGMGHHELFAISFIIKVHYVDF